MNTSPNITQADTQNIDPDPIETAEWKEAFLGFLASGDPERAKFILHQLTTIANKHQINWVPDLVTPYVNSIPVDQQPPFPGDLAIEEKLASLMRWNALAMVAKANGEYGELGGHIASYASAADLFEVGFNHFFRGRQTVEDKTQFEDLVFFQAHSAPGIYARAFLEGRLNTDDLAHYRQEITAKNNGSQGLSSYPHPFLMPDFWQFPTGSMGIGPISSIYHARFMRYLTDRQLVDCSTRKVWGVFGDGEMDEPESMSALTLASREKLDNLIWVVNCNLQRLDGPVRGNGQIINELEKLFRGSGWNVIKLLWGSDWDGLFARDTTGALDRAFAQTVDGQMQTFAAKDGRFNRENFFGQNPELANLVQGLTDEQIDQLKRGGHDIVKIYAAYDQAIRHPGQPTVILAHTKKGFGMGQTGQGKMTTHSQKKLDSTALIAYRNRFNLPLTDEQATNLEFFKLPENSSELQYLKARRDKLGGTLPKRFTDNQPLLVPELSSYAKFAMSPDGRELSTTMAFVRMLGNLLKDPVLGPRVVPIVADEARTFGMANLFKQVGIYSSVGQHYEPEDIDSVLSYREALDGQILEEGISEAGAIASWTAAATSYSVHGLAMIPFYIYYSMFGFQRVGDAIWAAADQMARGFLLGATSGRTTLSGEGLQHQDGSSHLVAATIPNCKAYDPAFITELAVIIDYGMRQMLEEQKDYFYYITLVNENYTQLNIPDGCEEDIIRGCYLLRKVEVKDASHRQVTLMGSGAILNEVIRAADLLSEHGIHATIFSVTSWSELARDGKLVEKNQMAQKQDSKTDSELAFITQQLNQSKGLIIAATDYVHAVPESIRAYIPQGRKYITLGTDGFGRSDTRAVLRDYFGVDAKSIVQAVLANIHEFS
ncbi:MAG: pyruvate dehydrogenase (acetyl-transferring), homodimeric type [Betaproteobacteria bacterium]